MVGFDVPHVAHDLILRFMGVDFSKIVQGGGAESTAHIPSTLGNDVKPTVSDAVSIDPGSGSQAGPGAGGGLSKGDTSKGTLGDDNKALWQSKCSTDPRVDSVRDVKIIIHHSLLQRWRYGSRTRSYSPRNRRLLSSSLEKIQQGERCVT
jgi:hypothetical protein